MTSKEIQLIDKTPKHGRFDSSKVTPVKSSMENAPIQDVSVDSRNSKLSKNSNISKNISNISSNSEDDQKKVAGSHKDIIYGGASNELNKHMRELSILPKASMNTEKLKERLEKFKEISTRRNSDITKDPKNIVDWKEKRKEFLWKKQKKFKEEEVLLQTLKKNERFRQIVQNEDPAAQIKTNKCILF